MLTLRSPMWPLCALAVLGACASANGGDDLEAVARPTVRRDASTSPADPGDPGPSAGGDADASIPVLPSTDAGSRPFDGSKADASVPLPVVDAAPPVIPEAGRIDAAVDAGILFGTATVGAVCAAAGDCRLAAPLAGSCSVTGPTPVCIATGCTVSTSSAADFCDSGRGVCLAANGANVCLQRCAFGTSGAAPTGCSGSNTCNFYGFGRDASGTISGIGYCGGTCASDAECAGGSVCQVEQGVCVAPAARRTFTSRVGDSCLVGGNPTCNCVGRRNQIGVCTKACVVGRPGTCPAGFVCAADVPRTAPDRSPAFTATPVGMAGLCYKACAGPGDCQSGAFCDENDTAGRVCKPMP